MRAENTLRALHEITTSRAEFQQQIREILAVGSQQFGLPIGAVLRVEGDRLRVEYVACPGDELTEETVVSTCDTFCSEVLKTGAPLAIVDAEKSGWQTHPGHRVIGIRGYLGAPIEVLGSKWGTVCFFDSQPAPRAFGPNDFDLLDLIAKRIQIGIEHESALSGFRAVLEGTAGATGTGFFRSMVRHLAQALDAEIAIVSECLEENDQLARTLAVWEDQQFGADFEFDIGNTPNDIVTNDGIRHYPDRVQTLFPLDADLRARGAEGFVGIPLYSHGGTRIGHLVAISRSRLDLTVYDRWLLQIFAARGGAELERTRVELERRRHERVVHTEKLKSLAVLASGMAHDFNDVLTGIIGHASLARRAVAPGSAAHHGIVAIEQAAERAEGLTKQMLGYAGRGTLAVERLDLTAVVSEMVELVQRTISGKAVLHREFSSGMPPIEADAAHIRQILMHLLMNASDGLGDASGEIHVRTGPCHVSSEELQTFILNDAMAPGAHQYIEIEDTGAGMAQTTVRQMFDPFFSTRISGSGLGLPAVLGIVSGHGGGIRVDTEIGAGTTVRVVLPLSRNLLTAPPREPSEAQAPSHIHGGVLVVDDEALVREVAKEILGGMGATVMTACDAEQAIEMLRRDPDSIDLVLLDHTMPNMTGSAAANLIHDLRPGTPILLMSGFDERAVRKESTTPDLAGFIQKPFKADTIVREVSRIMDLVD